MKHGSSRIHRVIDCMSFYITARYVGGAAVGIHMIGAILGIVFQNEHNRFLPDGAAAQIVHKHPVCQVIICTMSKGSRFSLTQSISVIAAESQGVQPGKRIYC